jgi:hypothetical protein
LIRGVTDEGEVSLSKTDFKGEAEVAIKKIAAKDVIETFVPKKSYKVPECLKEEDMEPEASDKYMIGLHQGVLASAMEVLRMECPTPSVYVRTSPGSKVYALKDYDVGAFVLLPISQALKEAKQGLFQCTIDNNTYELQKPTDFCPPAWYVRSSKEKREVNMKVIKKAHVTLRVSGSDEKDTSFVKKCIVTLLVNTKKLKNGTEIVVFKDAEKAPKEKAFGQI